MAWRRIFVTVALAASGCVGTPQPLPPNLAPDLLETVSERGVATRLVGGPGAVTPAGADLRIANLDRDDPVVEVSTGEDGRFDIAVPGGDGEELRFQVVAGEERSEPIDLLLSEGGLVPALRPLAGCFRAVPPLEARVREGEPLAISLENDCAEAVALSRVAMRREPSAFEVTEAPAEVAAGASASVVVSFAPDRAPDGEAILLVEVDAPERDRRAVTLVGD